MTLDGVMQAPGGKDEDRDGGFEHGGWTLPYWLDGIGKRRHYYRRQQPACASAVLEHDLVDELHLLLYPLTLGSGKRLLPNGVRTTFKLQSATPYPSGVVGFTMLGSENERPLCTTRRSRV
jgi:hypothetical protein